MLFMKGLMITSPSTSFTPRNVLGSPVDPACGYSEQMVELLNSQHLNFDYFDVLTDENVRVDLRELFKWPTYPQLFIEGKLIGGLDVTRDLISRGELQKLLHLKHS
jgi:glutaredoxin-related protein